MGGRELGYQVVYCGETLQSFVDGGWVFFQRPKHCGGGYWLGRTYPYAFVFGIERPVSLYEGIQYIMLVKRVETVSDKFDDDFELF